MACLLHPPHLKKVDTPEFTSFNDRSFWDWADMLVMIVMQVLKFQDQLS
jgi:hypothetical protein